MNQIIVNRLVQFSRKDYSTPYKIISLILGAIIFLCLIPALFIWLGLYLKEQILVYITKYFELIVSILGVVVGLFFVLWTALTQWKTGKGTPAPNAPTQYLVTTGPFKYCRNPIEFGAVLYYLGIGAWFGGIVVGIICSLLGLIIGSAYHKFIEEKELENRFGEEYRQYKEKTPFIFPRIFVSHKGHEGHEEHEES